MSFKLIYLVIDYAISYFPHNRFSSVMTLHAFKPIHSLSVFLNIYSNAGLPELDNENEHLLAYKIAQNGLCHMTTWSLYDHVSHLCLSTHTYTHYASRSRPWHHWIWLGVESECFGALSESPLGSHYPKACIHAAGERLWIQIPTETEFTRLV